MPVLVTAADTPLGADVVLRLLREGGQVRAYGSAGGDTTRLRQAGAVVATGDADDEGRIEAALEQVHTLVHLAAGPLAASADAVEVAATTAVRAATNAGVARIVATSSANADRRDADPLRSAHSALERALADAPVPSVVVRTSLVDTPALRDALAWVSLDEATLAAPVAPVQAEDLAELVAAFDSMRSTAHRGHVVFAADGPQRLSLAGYRERVGLGAHATASRVGRAYHPPDAHPLLAPSLALPWVTEDPEVFDAWAFTDLQPRPVPVVA